MLLDESINIIQLIERMENFSGAEIKATCTEAGYFAIRDRRTNIRKEDLIKAIEKVKQEEAREEKEHLHMFG